MSAEITKFLEAARELAEELQLDIQLAKTREEHIRVTARANAAFNLYSEMASELEPQVTGE